MVWVQGCRKERQIWGAKERGKAAALYLMLQIKEAGASTRGFGALQPLSEFLWFHICIIRAEDRTDLGQG